MRGSVREREGGRGEEREEGRARGKKKRGSERGSVRELEGEGGERKGKEGRAKGRKKRGSEEEKEEWLTLRALSSLPPPSYLGFMRSRLKK